MDRSDDALIGILRERAASPRRTDTSPPAVRRPASPEAVTLAEAAIGFSLDRFLIRVYLEVSDGGIGPGYGSLALAGDESLPSVYAEFRAGNWPEKLAPIWNWGDAIWSCVDPEGRVVTHDGVAGPTVTDFTVRSWLWAWTEGVDLWKELYEDKEATILNPFTRKPITTKVRGSAKGRPWPGP